jgi:type IV secretory pathway VirB2 component (pilin)
MKSLREWIKLSFALGILSLIAVIACHLALTDIWHGEGDLSLEWRILQVSFAVIILFQASTLLTLGRLIRRSGG